jgi:hypothetical protein
MPELVGKLTVTNQSADQEDASSPAYRSGYDKPKSLQDQVTILRGLFPGLGGASSLGQMELPDGAEGYFAVPRWDKIGKTYGEALQAALDVLSKACNGWFMNWRKGQLAQENFCQSATSAAMWKKIGTEQKGDMLIVAAQFGIRHRGRSVRRTREVMRKPEFGLGAFAVGTMLLTHENRLCHFNDLWIDCVGDEFHDAQESHAPFDRAPYFFFHNDRLSFDMAWVGNASHYCGSASGWFSPGNSEPGNVSGNPVQSLSCGSCTPAPCSKQAMGSTCES